MNEFVEMAFNDSLKSRNAALSTEHLSFVWTNLKIKSEETTDSKLQKEKGEKPEKKRGEINL